MQRGVDHSQPGRLAPIREAGTALLRRALASLSPAYREPVALRDIRELSYEDIAMRLQLPVGTVKSRLARAREALRTQLRDA